MRNPYYRGPRSDHFDGHRFFTPDHPSSDRGWRDLWRWRREARGALRAEPWPVAVPVVPARPTPRVAGLRVTMVGHASLLVQAGGLNLLTDPVWSDRASPVAFAGPRRVTAPGIRFADLPPIDAVLLSHNHYDHLDVATLRRLHAAHAPVFAMPLGNDAIVARAVPGARIAVGDWWDALPLADGYATTLTPAGHWSARGLRDRRMALWSGHFVTTPVGAVWFAGDTGYGTGWMFRAVRARLGPPRVALVPIGAYAPRWFMAAQHADPADAVRILADVGAAHALGVHWGTFRLTDEARDDPPARLADALAAAGVAPARFRAAVPGTAYDFAPLTA